MQALRLVAPALVLATVLSSIFLALGFATAARTTGDATLPSSVAFGPPTGALPDRTASEAPEGKTLSATAPAQDVRGEAIPGLPRCPGSVRVAYSETAADGLSVVRARFLAKPPPGAVRDFYAGVFGPGNWEMANVEYTGGEWYLLATRGAREAVVEVSSRGGGSLVKLEVSRPLGQEDGASAGGSKR